MRTRRTYLIAIPLLLAGLGAGCGDDDDAGGDGEGAVAEETTTTTAAAGEPAGDGDSPACAALQAVQEADDRSQAIVNEHLTPVLQAEDPAAAEAALATFLDAYRPFAEQELPGFVALYDELAALVPDDLRADVELLGDFTAEVGEGLSTAQSVEDVLATFTADPERAQAAAAATLRVDEFSRDECGIVLAD